MKNELFILIATLSFVTNGTAQEISNTNQKTEFQSASLITTCEKETTEYKFLSLVELNEEVDQIIKELDIVTSEKAKQNTCEITIEIKIEVTIGKTRGIMSGVIIVTDREDVETAAKRLKAMLLAATTISS